jgi:hypothetical protein
MAVVKGNDAVIKIGTTDATTWALSNFSLNFDRGTIEQELVGQEGNYYVPGSLSMDGSLTNCRFAASGNSPFLDSIVEGAVILISGCIGTDLLKFYLNSCQVTGYDVSIGDAATITEASIDFTVMNPKDITFEGTKVSG